MVPNKLCDGRTHARTPRISMSSPMASRWRGNKNMAVIQPRPTHILYQCAKFGDDRTSFNVIFEVCDV